VVRGDGMYNKWKRLHVSSTLVGCLAARRADGVDLDTVLLKETLAPPLLVALGLDACGGGGQHCGRWADAARGYSPRPSPISAMVSSIGRLLLARSLIFLSNSSSSGRSCQPRRREPVTSKTPRVTAAREPMPRTAGRRFPAVALLGSVCHLVALFLASTYLSCRG
jgi:hypothetical protein